MSKLKIRNIVILSLVLFIMYSSNLLTKAENDRENIIVLNSYSSGFKWTDDQVNGIVTEIAKENPDSNIYIEYLDQKNFSKQQVLDKNYELYKTKYADTTIDLLVTTDDAAMQFAINYREELFNDAPIIFGSVNEESALNRMANVDRISGVYENIDTEGTAQLISQLHEDIEKVYVVTEYTESGVSTLLRIESGFDLLGDTNIELVSLINNSFVEIKEILNKADEKSVAVMASYSTDKDGLVFSPSQSSLELATVSSIPIYILHDNSINDRIMGGSVLSGELHGNQIAKLANEYLNGTPIEAIAIESHMIANKVLNYPLLIKHGISEQRVPEGYTIINKPFSFYETYKTYIYIVIVTFSILILLIAGLFLNIRLRKKAQKELGDKHRELALIYDEVMASEEELRAQNEVLCLQQEQLIQSEEKYRLTSESAKDIHWCLDMVTGERFINDKLYQLLGYEIGSINTQEKWEEIIHPDDIKFTNSQLAKYLNHEDDKYSLEFRVKNVRGEYYHILSTAKGVKDSDGNYIKLYGTYTDITQAKKDHHQIMQMAYSDNLTKVHNRIRIKEITDALIRSGGKKKFALYFIDLDNFKFINNSFGHQVGDLLLNEVANRLKKLESNNIHVGRIGGDEFIVVDEDMALDIDEFTAKLLDIFRKPFNMEQRSIYSTASIGYVIYPDDGTTYDELLVRADIAMYKVKESGKNQIDRFSDSMEDEMSEKIERMALLSQAIDNDELYLEYQPLYDTETQAIAGFESLLRWENEKLGRISPVEFIPLAESCGLIIPIGKFVLRKAFQFAKDINEHSEDKLTIAINISVIQLFGNDFVDYVKGILDEVGVAPSLIEFEVTESIYAENFEMFKNQLLRIKKLGISLSLDDFGTGYSSLTYLRMMPFSKLKIDKKFIDDILIEEHDHVLLETIISLGHNLGIDIVAEGVEEEEQYEYIKSRKCQLTQGYYFSKPLKEDACYRLLKEMIVQLL